MPSDSLSSGEQLISKSSRLRRCYPGRKIVANMWWMLKSGVIVDGGIPRIPRGSLTCFCVVIDARMHVHVIHRMILTWIDLGASPGGCVLLTAGLLLQVFFDITIGGEPAAKFPTKD
eukprot:979094-Pyramimonas_sp.AAC.3